MNVYHALAVARASLPRLTLAQRVVDKIVANAMVYETETGESLIGFATKVAGRPEPDLYAIDTIPPDESAIRRGAYFEQGDLLQSDIFNWLFDNWNLARKNTSGGGVGAKWDMPLMNLGDWHKHPGTLVEPSWGDTDTARSHIFDEVAGIPQLLAILATVWDRSYAEAEEAEEKVLAQLDLTPSQAEHEPRPIKIPVDSRNLVRIDCWYMSRLTRRFVRLTPQITDNKLLPELPIIGWHIDQPERMNAEMKALNQDGYSVSVDQHDADGEPPFEICLSLARRSSQYVLMVVTHASYPEKMPTVRTVPISVFKAIPEDADLFVNLWPKAELLPKEGYPDWEWTPDRTIAELARAVEAKLTERSAAS
jgi:hypothetical protein